MKKRTAAALTLAICTVLFSVSHAYASDNPVRIHASLKDTPDGGYAQVSTAMHVFRAKLEERQAQGCTLKDPPVLSLSPEEIAITATFVCP